MIPVISEIDFEDKTCFDSDHLDFVAKCYTPWHLTGVKAFINYLLDVQGRANGYIFIRYHGESGYVISQKELTFPKESNISVFLGMKPQKKGISYVIKDLIKYAVIPSVGKKDLSHKIYILNSFFPDYRFCSVYERRCKKACIPVCIDEGVGSYKTRRELFGEQWRKNRKSAVVIEIKKAVDFIRKIQLTSSSVYFTIFSYKNGALVVNDKIKDYYVKSLTNNEVVNEISDKPYVLFLTQPFELTEEIDSKEEINNEFDHVAKKFINDGLKVIIKPHPREKEEDIQNYIAKGYEVIDNRVPIERLLLGLTNKPQFVVGTHSTALVTASVLCNVKAISIVHLLRKNVPRAFSESAKIFERRYGMFVSFIEESDL